MIGGVSGVILMHVLRGFAHCCVDLVLLALNFVRFNSVVYTEQHDRSLLKSVNERAILFL